MMSLKSTQISSNLSSQSNVYLQSNKQKKLYEGYITCSHCQIIIIYQITLSLIHCPKCSGLIKITYVPYSAIGNKSNLKLNLSNRSANLLATKSKNPIREPHESATTSIDTSDDEDSSEDEINQGPSIKERITQYFKSKKLKNSN